MLEEFRIKQGRCREKEKQFAYQCTLLLENEASGECKFRFQIEHGFLRGWGKESEREKREATEALARLKAQALHFRVWRGNLPRDYEFSLERDEHITDKERKDYNRLLARYEDELEEAREGSSGIGFR